MNGVWAKTAQAAVLIIGTATLSGCGDFDRKGDLSRADYEALAARRGEAQTAPMAPPPIPRLSPVVAAPTPPDMVDERRITIDITDQTPLRDVLIELADKAEIDLELDPRITDGIIFKAKDRPLREVITRLCDLAGLRCTLDKTALRVVLDEPYTATYRLDALNLKRTTNTEINASTDVFSAVGDGNADGNGSSAKIAAEGINDLWGDITQSITAIVNEPDGALRMASGAARVVVVDTPTDTPADGTTTPPATTAATTVTTASAAAAAPAATAATETGEYITVNRQAGVITAFTSGRKQAKIAAYIGELQRSLGAQVLIEAKVVEVTLDDQFRAGINWQWFGLDGLSIAANLATGIIPSGRIDPTLSANLSSGPLNLTGVLDLLSTFGTTRTLSSPRLTATNNQPALLKVAENEVYFTLQIDRETNGTTGNETRTITSELHTVPIGLLMVVQPAISADGKTISLNLRPTISRIVKQVEDPAVQLAMADINAANNTTLTVSSPIPVVQVREMDSVVTMGTGSILVMGGLMQERAENGDEKVPGLADVPLAGDLFKRRDDKTTVSELVIFLRATVIRDRDSVHPADVDLYRTFTPDPRPFGF